MRDQVLVFTASVIAALAACSSDRTTDTTEGDPDGGDRQEPSLEGCSADLQSVIDADGGEHPCPAGQGCADGACVPACEAAAETGSQLGCSFHVPTPRFFDARGGCHALFVVNGWDEPVTFDVGRGAAAPIDLAAYAHIASDGDISTWPLVGPSGLAPGEVAVVFLSQPDGGSYGCPVPSATVDAGIVGDRPAWRLDSTLPVTLYDILPYGGAQSYLPSAALLWPIAAWGDEHVVITPVANVPNSFANGRTWLQLVAGDRPTTATVRPTTDLDGAPAAVETTFALAAGEVRTLIPLDLYSDLTGSVVTADGGIGVFSGNTYFCFATGTAHAGGGCDSTHQASPPVASWGDVYVATPPETRRADLEEESLGYRVVAAVDGTRLTFDPPIVGAPSTLDAGQVAAFEAVGPFVIRAQDRAHPIQVSQLLSGCSLDVGSRPGSGGEFGCLGDEEIVGLLPSAQFLREYVFFTDPTYATSTLAFTRRGGAAAAPVEVDCLGEIGGWRTVGDGEFEVATVDLVRGGAGVGACRNGRQAARSASPFGLVVWGLDDASSYAYPAGGNLARINDVVVE